MSKKTTYNPEEVAQFDRLGRDWWDENGPMKPLHRLNPVRIGYIRDQAVNHFSLKDKNRTPLHGLCVLDIGCGGGLVAEPLARLGAAVTGIDAGRENIAVAAEHAAAQELKIDYQNVMAEDLAASGARYDIVTALEVVEHVDEVPLFLASAAQLVRPGGMLVISTLSRTAKSFLLGIVAAEYVLRWLPAGTHDWKKFLKPSEIAKPLSQSGLVVTDICGLTYSPLSRDFALDRRDLSVNYLLTAIRPRD